MPHLLSSSIHPLLKRSPRSSGASHLPSLITPPPHRPHHLLLLPNRRSYASYSKELEQFSLGSTCHGFQVEQVKTISDFDLTAVRLKHQKTGADHLHIFKEDTNNVFAVGFQTAPKDSTGVPHILEHTVLCGSEKYPVRDPFFKMLNRSMSTFMNAMTWSDFTMYPFSTENRADYNNLFDVYMDAVFRPRLRELDFKQEGWRLEHENPTDPKTPIVFKGVVYNEMKGVFSDVNNIFLTRLQQAMYPKTTYSHVSGGDPEAITDLTHEQLVEFHRTCYHPSNARFFTYGTFPLSEHLKKIDERISGFGRVGRTEIGMAEFEKPLTLRASCPPDPMGDPEKQTRMAITYLTNDGTDTFESFATRMLSTLLTDGAASPMYRALIESNIGSDYAASTGYDRTSRQTCFSVGLQGMRTSDVPKVAELIEGVFADLVRSGKGFGRERVESALHQVEIGLKHRTAKFGLGLSQSVMQHWMHGGDPVDAMEVSKYINRLRAELETPGFFESRIEKYFLNNKHKLTFIMEPSETYAAEIERNEVERLQKKVESLTEADRKKVYEDGLKLLELQDAVEDISCLPTLTVDDVPKKGKTYPVSSKVLQTSQVPVQIRETATNGVSYVTLMKSIAGLKKELALSALGTTRTPSVPDLDERIRLYTSGVSSGPNLQTSPLNHRHLTSPYITYSTSMLPRNLQTTYDIISELLQGPSYESVFRNPTDPKSMEFLERLKTVLGSTAAGGMNSLADAGHRYAVGLASEGLSSTQGWKGQMGGVGFVMGCNGLVEKGEEGVWEVLRRIKEIHEYILNTNESGEGVKAAVISTGDMVDGNVQALDSLLKDLGWSSTCTSQTLSPKENTTSPPVFKNTYVPLPFTVNYTARAFVGTSYTDPDAPSLQILAELLTSRFLHKEVREKGGAYGAFATYNPVEGVFSMASYRDPPGAAERTMRAYERGVEWALGVDGYVGERELNEAKLSILSGLDAPVSASQEGMTKFMSGITDEMRQTRRERLFGVTLQSVRQAAEKYLTGPSAKAILGPTNEVELVQDREKMKGESWEVLSVGGAKGVN
ncbi:Presequence protease, mitochondrial [Chytridiales sp. JEL 0842]|nr:Presequence protease, mitochondrial [Chytridiales sp. JEL 0842]